MTTDIHGIDPARTVTHDLDRAGDYYDAWCVCGEQIAAYAPHHLRSDGPGGSIEEGLERHRKAVAKADQVTVSLSDLLVVLQFLDLRRVVATSDIEMMNAVDRLGDATLKFRQRRDLDVEKAAQQMERIVKKVATHTGQEYQDYGR